MKGIHRFTKKEKTIFWSAAMIGIVGGVIGNLFASALWQSVLLLLGNNGWAYLIIVILISLSFFYIIKSMGGKIEKNRPDKRSFRKR
jgi:quinol-cytochrome oxidoreductase complex cytochrome b subunit